VPLVVLIDDHRERLRLFNELAEKLLGTSFVQNGTKLTITFEEGKPLAVDLGGMDDESVDAFVLTVRFFIQDGDRISFRTIAEIYEDPSLPAKLAEHFRAQRDKLNAYLDAPSPTTVNVPRSRREVLDIFVYGGLAHANADKRRVFKEWRDHPVAWPLMQNEFAGSLYLLAECVSHVRALNLALLDGGGSLALDETP
jgi:hypothetical protein